MQQLQDEISYRGCRLKIVQRKAEVDSSHMTPTRRAKVKELKNGLLCLLGFLFPQGEFIAQISGKFFELLSIPSGYRKFVCFLFCIFCCFFLFVINTGEMLTLKVGHGGIKLASQF